MEITQGGYHGIQSTSLFRPQPPRSEATGAFCCSTKSEAPPIERTLQYFPPAPLSDDMQKALLTQQEDVVPAPPSPKGVIANGGKPIDLDAVFSNNPKPFSGFSLDNLILPSGENIAAISAHVTDRLKQAMQTYGITNYPSKIQHDGAGEIRLPADYADADAFKSMLENEPGLAKELRTLNALSSHYQGFKRAAEFAKAAEQAKSEAELDRLMLRFGDLFNKSGSPFDTALSIAEDGTVSAMYKGNALV